MPEQDQTRLGVRGRDLANFAIVAQRADIEDQYARVVHPKHVPDARRRDVLRYDRDARIGFESGLETQREEVLEAGDGDSDG